MEAPFRHWYAIVDSGCWYVGMHLDRESAQKQAIKEFHVQFSKAGYCILDSGNLETTYLSIKDRLEKDSE